MWTAINVGSIAVLTALGTTMMLEQIKEKKEHALREEVKDRVNENLRESHARILKLESNVAELVSFLLEV